MKRRALLSLAALLWAASLHAENGRGGALYVAGERVSLEQAIADATLDALGPDESTDFQVLALAPELRKLTVKGTKRNVRDAVREMQRAGGIFYVCERDLKQAGLAKKDLLSGVRIEHPVAGKTPAAFDASAAPLARIRSLC